MAAVAQPLLVAHRDLVLQSGVTQHVLLGMPRGILTQVRGYHQTCAPAMHIPGTMLHSGACLQLPDRQCTLGQ
jgi:hypothetical protein